MQKTINIIISFVLAIITLIIIIFLSLGINLDFSQVKTWAFWVEVFTKWALTMILFNISFEYSKIIKTHDKAGRFFAAFATLRIRIREIHTNKRYEDLEEAIKKKNEQNIKDLWTARLRRISAHICYDDVFNTELSAEDFAEANRIIKRRKKFLKLFEKIKQGEEYKHYGLFPYKPIKEDYFLKDNELSRVSVDKFDYSSKGESAKRNVAKSFSFFLTIIITTIITYAFYKESFWGEIINNLFTASMAAMSGFTYSARDMKYKTQIYENRNDFLERNLGITDVWEPDKETND